jgi:hypothetical protein
MYSLVLVHALVSGVHGWSHFYTGVPITLAQSIFIATVIVAMPLLAVVLLTRRRMSAGCAVLSLSMLGSFIFGVVFHFILDTPDMYSNVYGHGAQMFRISAILLAALELIGFVWGLSCWQYLKTCRSNGIPLQAAELQWETVYKNRFF